MMSGILASVRGMDTVARMGGDEFIILVDQIAGEADLRRIHGDLKNTLVGKLYVEGHQIALSASIGRAIFPRDGITIDDLLKMGDREMYVAKKRARIQAVKQFT